MKKNKFFLAATIIGILLVVTIMLSSTYAYWQITRKQASPNDIVAMCLDLTINSEKGTFGVSDAWPVTDEEGKVLEGYTFTVKNNCKKPINYIIGLNSLVDGNDSNYLNYDSIKVMIDESTPLTYGDLTDVKYNNPKDLDIVRDSKQLSVETIEGEAINTHNVKAWIDEDADIENQGKLFSGKVFITGGQGIVSGDQCFTIAQDGTIWGYNEDCGLNVAVPAEINGIEVKTINRASFNDGILTFIAGYGNLVDGNSYENHDAIVVIRNEEERTLINDNFKSQLDDYWYVDNVIVLDSLDDYYEYDFSKYGEIYMDVFWLRGSRYTSALGKIKTLDLSEAVHLEKIEMQTLTSGGGFEVSVDDSCEYSSSGSVPYYYCKGALKELFLPMNGVLKEIEAYAFFDNQLVEVAFPNTLRKLAGFDNNYIAKLDIPRSVEVLGGFAENPITELYVPSNVRVISADAFSARANSFNSVLRKVTLEDTLENPSQLTTIESDAFAFNNLYELTIPSSVQEIGDYAFHHNQISSLRIVDTLEKPSHLKNIGFESFSYNRLGQVVIPGSVTDIGSRAFYQNVLKKVIIKRTADDALAKVTFGDNWNHGSTIIYNPNYIQ